MRARIVDPPETAMRILQPPEADAWLALREAAAHCRACPLWRHATQTVFGAGNPHAPLMLVGEQPGDQEDRRGLPFVGPAGRLLQRALDEACIAGEAVYVTNAVKHFKWVAGTGPRGKRRLHKMPAQAEIAACNGWLRRELALLRPARVVALGATAARALLGRPVPVNANRGQWHDLELEAADLASGEVDGRRTAGAVTRVLVTLHPAALLRMPGEVRAQAYGRFVADLRLARVPGPTGLHP